MSASIPSPELAFPEHLPVSARRDDIAAALAAHAVVIVCGETGSGKTTQLPKIALAAGRGVSGRIGMTQPRRIAARSVAQRLAEETRTRLGGFIGWQVRFSDQVGPESRIKVMTDGILLAETQSDPEFRGYDTLILDEAHERSLNIDFLLGYLKALLPRRPDLKLVISSATLEADRFAAYFGGTPVIEVSGRTWPVEVRYRPPRPPTAEPPPARKGDPGGDVDDAELERALLHAVDELAAEGQGDILVFLPGEREIRDAQEALRKHHPPHTEILPLYARLSVAEQERVFQPHVGRRIVLATNVAETSLTVPGIRYVVDTGLARVKRYSIRNKIEQLKIERISQAAANQRAGRCGRVAEGICIRLYDEADFQARPKYTTPELLRSSLAGVILRMKALRLADIDAFPFLDAPEPRRVRDGRQLLQELGALDEHDRLTAIGRQLARLPVDPRIGRMLIAARDGGCLRDVLVIAAALSSQDPRERPLERRDAADQQHRRFDDEQSDFIALLKLWAHVDHLNQHRKSQRKLRETLKAEFLSPQRVREWRDVHGQLTVQVKELGWKVEETTPPTAGGEPTPATLPTAAHAARIHQALLPGLLGNLGMLTEDGVYLGARDLKFLLFPGSGVRKKPKWVMAAEIVETRRVYARTVARIEPDWVEHAARHLLRLSYSDPHWAKKPAQVVASLRGTLYGLPVINGRKVHYGPIDPVLSRELFLRGALVRGEYDTRAPWFVHNRRLLANIDELAQRARNARLNVDEHVLYRWFDARVPAGIHNGAAFERWRREAERSQPRLLFLRREDLLEQQPDSTARDFPPAIEFNGVRFALAYRFDPGAEDDGVTLVTPLAALNQIPAIACEWLVPGLLEEKLAALLKSLPQSARRAFVPVPHFARAAREALADGAHDLPLSEALAVFLRKTTGQTVARDAWREDALPAHLRMNFRVVDAAGKPLAQGRDLAALRQRFGAAASAELSRRLRGADGDDLVARYSREDVTRWDFGDLPDHVRIAAGARAGLVAFPALQMRDDGGVRLALFDTADQAAEAHRLGVARLVWLAHADLLRQSERDLAAALKATCLQYGLLFKGASCAELLRDVLNAAALAALGGDQAPPRDAAAFAAASGAARPRLPERLTRASALARDVIAAAMQLAQALERAPAAWRDAVEDLRVQLAGLVFPGFLTRHPVARLPDLPRYLKAMQLRLDKLPHHAARDLGAMNEMAPLLAAWRQRAGAVAQRGERDAALDDFRWRLEELRVGLFAQELRTPEPVSVKRLEKRWREIVG
jgi:ATP-dependent helicase HrpA